MAFSVEIQVRAKNTYARLVCSLSEIGALFSTGGFVARRFCRGAVFGFLCACHLRGWVSCFLVAACSVMGVSA